MDCQKQIESHTGAFQKTKRMELVSVPVNYTLSLGLTARVAITNVAGLPFQAWVQSQA